MGAEISLFPSLLHSPEQQESWCSVCSEKSDYKSKEIRGKNQWEGIRFMIGKDYPIKVSGEQNPEWSIAERRVVLKAIAANPVAMHNGRARRALFESLKESGYLPRKTLSECEEYGNYLAKQAAAYNAFAATEFDRLRCEKSD
jgi:hypothetical protein